MHQIMTLNTMLNILSTLCLTYLLAKYGYPYSVIDLNRKHCSLKPYFVIDIAGEHVNMKPYFMIDMADAYA